MARTNTITGIFFSFPPKPLQQIQKNKDGKKKEKKNNYMQYRIVTKST